MIGIYKITNLVNGKCYIGQSHDINRRWIVHRSRPFQNISHEHDSYLYRSIRKYGLENFSFEVLEECDSEDLSDREKYYIDFYHSFDPRYGYNMTRGGEGRLMQDREYVLELWNQGDTISAIAKKISGSRNTVKDILRELNVDFSAEAQTRWIKKASRRVNQYTKDMELIRTWPSAKEAERQLHIDHTGIGDCCNYMQKQAGGFKWRYADRSATAALADLLD